MRSIRAQYFLTWAVVGALMPYVPVFFLDRGLSLAQIGDIYAVSSLAVLLAPVLITLLADTHIDPRRLMAAANLLGILVLLALAFTTSGFVVLLVLYTAYSLLSAPLPPLQDGINFAIQQRRREQGLPPESYHRIRVWGTIGFLAPTAVLFVLFQYGVNVRAALLAGAGFALLGAISALRLPPCRPPQPAPPSPGGAAPMPPMPLPTLAAARALLAPHMLVFCLVAFLLQLAMASYYSFYSVYLHQQLHLANKWLGPIQNVGVAVEIVYVLSFGWLMRKLGIRGLLLLCVLGVALRLALLSAFPVVAVVVAAQAMHGLASLLFQVLPPVFLNMHADDRFRHSMQGLFAMGVAGTGRIAGNFIAGHTAGYSLRLMYAQAAGLCLVGALLVLIAFRDKSPAPQSPAVSPAAAAAA